MLRMRCFSLSTPVPVVTTKTCESVVQAEAQTSKAFAPKSLRLSTKHLGCSDSG